MLRAPRSIAGTDAWGELDDLLIEDVSLIRLERVDRDRWCLVCYRGNRRVLVHLEARPCHPKDCRLSVTVIEDELGCDPETGDRMAAALFPPEVTTPTWLLDIGMPRRNDGTF